ncbi:MAG: FAD/NAD(P)-binding protein [Thermoplasmata archaeon]
MNKNLSMITILDAGLSGLYVTYHYPGKSIIFLKYEKIGGTTCTINDHGFLYDYRPHVSFTKDPYIINLLLKFTSIFEKTVKLMNTFKGNLFPLRHYSI